MANEEMKTEEINNNTNKEEKKKDKKCIIKIVFLSVFTAILLIYGLYIYILSRPLKDADLYCYYKGKFNKIVCVQTGDVVPEWLEIEDNAFLKYLGIDSSYSMKLVLSHSNSNYRTLNMVKKEFIKGMNRKFIYELPEQTFKDWINFKKYTFGCNVNNWGSVVLYCSDSNMENDICKRMKKQHNK